MVYTVVFYARMQMQYERKQYDEMLVMASVIKCLYWPLWSTLEIDREFPYVDLPLIVNGRWSHFLHDSSIVYVGNFDFPIDWTNVLKGAKTLCLSSYLKKFSLPNAHDW